MHQQAQQAPSYQPITPHVPFTPQPAAPMQAFQTPRPAPGGYQQPYIQQMPSGYKAPQPVEVYVLNDHANANIPEDIREQFKRDEKGRVLFFTAPPLNVEPPLTKDGHALGHSARYLAAKVKKEASRADKRKTEEANVDEREAAAKKAKADDELKFKTAVAELGSKALSALENQLAMATRLELDESFGTRTQQGIALIVDQLAEAQKVTARVSVEREKHLKEREASRRIVVAGMTARLEEKY